MKVMVIGGTSFIGPVLVRRLVDLGNTVAVFHRGQTRAELPPMVEHILGDRRNLEQHTNEVRRFGPEVVVDMVAFTEADAIGLVETFRGLARRSVVISSADVYQAYGRFIGLESGPVEPTPLGEDAPLRTVAFPVPAARPRDWTTSITATTRSRLSGSCWAIPACPAPCFDCRWSTVRAISITASLPTSNEWMIGGRPSLLTRAWLAGSARVGTFYNVAAAIALAVVDDRAMGGVFNVADPAPFTEAEWIHRIGEVAGWRGKAVSVPTGRIPVPYHVEQILDTDSGRIRQVLGYHEDVGPSEALERTIAWERTNACPAGPTRAMGILDYDAEDALLAELGDSLG